MSNVAVISVSQALECISASLGVAAEAGALLPSRVLIAQTLRRAAFNAAPCTAQVLRSLVFAALSPLAQNAHALKADIEEALEDLIVMGDLLEMHTDVDGGRDVVLRPAPPAFVARRDGMLIILGVAGDEITPVPVLHQESGLRCIRPDNAQACRAELLDLGLIELSERQWLFAPAPVSAADVMAHWKAKLPADTRPEKIEGLELLQAPSASSYYKGRWTTLTPKLTGIFVARRGQRYGAKLWCLAEVTNGLVQRFVDIRAKDSRTRDCDEAWRLQAAMDAAAGMPQRIRIISAGSTTTLAFSAPLPAWAARRLSFIGKPAPTARALLAFEIPTTNAQDELRWLSENLWLVRDQEGETA